MGSHIAIMKYDKVEKSREKVETTGSKAKKLGIIIPGLKCKSLHM